MRIVYIGAHSFAGVRSGQGAACAARWQVGGEREALHPLQKMRAANQLRRGIRSRNVYAGKATKPEALAIPTFLLFRVRFNSAVNRDFRNSCVHLCKRPHTYTRKPASEPKAVQ